MKNDKDKITTEINEAFYKYEKGLIFILTSEFSTLAINFKDFSDTKEAHERAQDMLKILEDYLRMYTCAFTI